MVLMGDSILHSPEFLDFSVQEDGDHALRFPALACSVDLLLSLRSKPLSM